MHATHKQYIVELFIASSTFHSISRLFFTTVAQFYNDSLTQVLHRHKSGQRKTKTVSITLHCYDVRVVKLTFVSDIDGGADVSDSKSAEFLASSSSCQTDRGGGGGGEGGGATMADRSKIAQVLRGVTDKVKGYGLGGVAAANDLKPEVKLSNFEISNY